MEVVLFCLSLALVRAAPKSRDLGSDFNLIPISICDKEMLKNLKNELVIHANTMLMKGTALMKIKRGIDSILEIALQSMRKAEAAVKNLTYADLPYDFLAKKLHMMTERVSESVAKMCPPTKLELKPLSLANHPYKDSMVAVIDKADLSDQYFEVTFSQVGELLKLKDAPKVKLISDLIENFIDKNLKAVYTCLDQVTDANGPKVSEKYTSNDYSVVLKFFEKLINYQKTGIVFKGLFGSETRLYKARPEGNFLMGNFFSTIESDDSAIFHFLRMDSAWLELPSRKPLTFRNVKVAITRNYAHIPALLNVADMHAEHFFSKYISPRYVAEAQRDLYYIMLHLISLKIITSENYRYAGHIIRQWILGTKCWHVGNLAIEEEQKKEIPKTGNPEPQKRRRRRRILPQEISDSKNISVKSSLQSPSAEQLGGINSQVPRKIATGISSGFRINRFARPKASGQSQENPPMRRPLQLVRFRYVKADPIEWDEFGILAKSRVPGAIPLEPTEPVPVETSKSENAKIRDTLTTEHNSQTELHLQGKESELIKEKKKSLPKLRLLRKKPENKEDENREDENKEDENKEEENKEDEKKKSLPKLRPLRKKPEKKEEALLTWQEDSTIISPAKDEAVTFAGCGGKLKSRQKMSWGQFLKSLKEEKPKDGAKDGAKEEPKEEPKVEYKIYSTIFEKNHPFKFQDADCVISNAVLEAILEAEAKESKANREEICEIKKLVPNFATFFTMIWRMTRVMDGWTTKLWEKTSIATNTMLLSLFDQSLLHAEQDIETSIKNILSNQKYYKMVVEVLGENAVYSIGEAPVSGDQKAKSALGALAVNRLGSYELVTIQEKKKTILASDRLKGIIACTAFKADVKLAGNCTYEENPKLYSESIANFFDVMSKAETHVSEFFISLLFTILKESLEAKSKLSIPKNIASKILLEMNNQIVVHQISLTKAVQVDGFVLFSKDLLFGRGLSEVSSQAPALIKSNPSMLYDLRFFLLEKSQPAEFEKFKALASEDTTSGLSALLANGKPTNFETDTELYNHRLGLQLFNKYVKIFDYYDFTKAGRSASPELTPERAMNDLFSSIYFFLSEVRMSKEIEGSNFHMTVWLHLTDCLSYTKDRELLKSSDPNAVSLDKCPMALRKYTEIFYFIFFFIAKDEPEHLSEYLTFSSERIEYRLDPFFRYLYFPETDLLSQVKEVCSMRKDWSLCIGVNVFHSFKLFMRQGGSNFGDFYIISLKNTMVNINNFIEKGIAEEADEKPAGDAEKTPEEVEREKTEAAIKIPEQTAKMKAEAAEKLKAGIPFRRNQIRAILWNVMFSLSKIDNGKFLKLIDQGRLQYKAFKKKQQIAEAIAEANAEANADANAKTDPKTDPKEEGEEFFKFFDLVEFQHSVGNEADVEFLADFLRSRFASRRHSSEMKGRTELIESFWQDFVTNKNTEEVFILHRYAISEILEFLSKYTHSLDGFKAIARALIRGNIVLDMVNWTYSSINEFEQFYLETLEPNADFSLMLDKKKPATLLGYIDNFKNLIVKRLESISNSFNLEFRIPTTIKEVTKTFKPLQPFDKSKIDIKKLKLRAAKINFADPRFKNFPSLRARPASSALLNINIDLDTIIKKFCQFNSKGEIYLSDDTINKIFRRSTYKFCWVNVSVTSSSQDKKSLEAETVKSKTKRNII